MIQQHLIFHPLFKKFLSLQASTFTKNGNIFLCRTRVGEYLCLVLSPRKFTGVRFHVNNTSHYLNFSYYFLYKNFNRDLPLGKKRGLKLVHALTEVPEQSDNIFSCRTWEERIIAFSLISGKIHWCGIPCQHRKWLLNFFYEKPY